MKISPPTFSIKEGEEEGEEGLLASHSFGFDLFSCLFIPIVEINLSLTRSYLSLNMITNSNLCENLILVCKCHLCLWSCGRVGVDEADF